MTGAQKNGLPLLTGRGWKQTPGLTKNARTLLQVRALVPALPELRCRMQFSQFSHRAQRVVIHTGTQQPVYARQPLLLFLRVGSGRKVANGRRQVLKGFPGCPAEGFHLHCLQAMAVPLHPSPESGHIHPLFAEYFMQPFRIARIGQRVFHQPDHLVPFHLPYPFLLYWYIADCRVRQFQNH